MSSSSITSRNEVESVLNKVPANTYSSKQVSFDTILRFSNETFRKLPRHNNLCSKDGPLARAAACIDYVLRERYGAEAKLQDLAKAAYMKPKDLKGAMHQIRQWIVNNEATPAAAPSKKGQLKSIKRKMQVQGSLEPGAATTRSNDITMNELVIQCSSCDDNVTDVIRSANSLLTFCKSKALEVHKSKYMSSKKDLDRNRMAYMAACFLFVSDRSVSSNASTGSCKADRVEKVLKIARVAKTGFRRVEKFVQMAGKEWKKSYFSDYYQNHSSQCSSQRSKKAKQMVSSKRSNIMGKASSTHYNDTNFVKKLEAAVAKADARAYEEEEDAGEKLRNVRLNSSRVRRLAELPNIDDWKKEVLDRAKTNYGSISKAADAIAASHLDKGPKESREGASVATN